MPKKICNQVGCNNLVEMSEIYCIDHKRDVIKTNNRLYDKHKRNQKHNKFYNSSEWRRMRTSIMQSTGGLCARCLELDIITIANVVDHIIPLTKDYSKRLERSNLRPLCHRCHNIKTANDVSLYGEGA